MDTADIGFKAHEASDGLTMSALIARRPCALPFGVERRCYASGAVVREAGGRRLTLRYVPVRATVRLGEAETARHLEEQEPISSGIFLKDLKSEEQANSPSSLEP